MMHRIAFLLSSNNGGWLGGANYIRNLFRSIESIEERKIEPVVFCHTGEAEAVSELVGNHEIVTSHWLAEGVLRRTLRSVVRRIRETDMAIERTMMAKGIGCVSHSGCFGAGFPIPVINWLADFQHRRLPDMFSTEERSQRDRAMSQVVRCSDRVILSSNNASRDLVEFWPEAANKAVTLPFAVSLGDPKTATVRQALAQKYDLASPYFYLPNQFWKHKNHTIVVEALALLKARGKEVVVVCSGMEYDHRDPHYFVSLMQRVEAWGLMRCFRSLGVVPREDVFGLIRNCVSMINPSLFEGWSTSVEEARAIGKRIILSDIAVHREQAPARGAYFDPSSAEALAKAFLDALAAYDEEADERAMAEAAPAMKARARSYGDAYQQIVLQMINDFDRVNFKMARKAQGC